MKRGASIATALALTVLVVCNSVALAAPPPSLSLAGEEKIAVAGSGDDDTATADLFVIDSGKSVPIGVEFRSPNNDGVELTGLKPNRVRAEGVTPIEVTFSGLSDLDGAAMGAVVLKGGRAPVVREATVTPGLRPSAQWPKVLVVGAVIVTVLLFLAIVVTAAIKGGTHLRKKAPGPEWSFESWATSLTAVGAIVGTIVAAAAYPPEPSEISKDSLVSLALLFGALVVIAPFIFQSIRNPRASAADQKNGLWGYSWALLLSCTITCGAVLGELGCLGLLSHELIGGTGWADAALVVVGAVAVLAVYYFTVTAWSLAATDWETAVAEETITVATIKPPAARQKAAPDNQGLVLGIAGAEEAESAAPAAIEIKVATPRARRWKLP